MDIQVEKTIELIITLSAREAELVEAALQHYANYLPDGSQSGEAEELGTAIRGALNTR